MIRIISRKVPACSSLNFGVYVNKLSENAKEQPGFIKSDSFWCREHDQIISISDWQSKNEWVKWYKSKRRNDISKMYNKYVREEHFHTLYKTNTRYRDIFLL